MHILVNRTSQNLLEEAGSAAWTGTVISQLFSLAPRPTHDPPSGKNGLLRCKSDCVTPLLKSPQWFSISLRGKAKMNPTPDFSAFIFTNLGSFCISQAQHLPPQAICTGVPSAVNTLPPIPHSSLPHSMQASSQSPLVRGASQTTEQSVSGILCSRGQSIISYIYVCLWPLLSH